jgi:hypothetical protein
MKRYLTLALLALIPLLAPAATLDLGIHGTFGITPPKDWKFSAQKGDDGGTVVTLSPPGQENARCIINVTLVPNPEPTSKDKVQEAVLALCDRFVDESVEKKKVLRDLAVPGGVYGCYCVFTDASMVGQPPKHDEFKVIGIGIVQFNDEVMAAVSIAADDAKGSDFVSLLAAVSSMSLGPKR